MIDALRELRAAMDVKSSDKDDNAPRSGQPPSDIFDNNGKHTGSYEVHSSVPTDTHSPTPQRR